VRDNVRTIDVPGGRFLALDPSPSDAPLVLCLHGFPDHPPSFEPLMQRLADSSYRPVAPWMRGYRPSVTEGPFHLEQIARDIIELADELSPDQPVHLIGHDWGAVATYVACAFYPQRIASAVTMAVPHPLAFASRGLRDGAQLRKSWYMFAFQLPLLPERLIRRNGGAFIDRLWRTWSPGYHAAADDMRAVRECVLESLPAPLEYYRAMVRPIRDVKQRTERLARTLIEVPVRYLQGADDGCIGPNAWLDQARWFSGPFDELVLPGLGHFLQLEDPELIAELCIEWMSSGGDLLAGV
jgi:pimeloyl-ACP methyl ester carboxylesterase